jgi:hypothetical protein
MYLPALPRVFPGASTFLCLSHPPCVSCTHSSNHRCVFTLKKHIILICPCFSHLIPHLPAVATALDSSPTSAATSVHFNCPLGGRCGRECHQTQAVCDFWAAASEPVAPNAVRTTQGLLTTLCQSILCRGCMHSEPKNTSTT